MSWFVQEDIRGDLKAMLALQYGEEIYKKHESEDGQ